MHVSNSEQFPALSHLLRLDGRVALVVGGAGYLGSQAADVLAEMGAQVVIASRDFAACMRKASEISARHPNAPQPMGAHIDLMSRESVLSTIEKIVGEHTRIDIVANFAWTGTKNSLDSIDEDAWDFDVDLSLGGTFRLVKAALPHLRRTRGVVLNVASMYGVVAPNPSLYPSPEFVNPPSYGAAKAGVVQFTRYLAAFLGREGIRANCLSPGPFPFPSTLSESPDFAQRLASMNPLGRVGYPYELRGATAFLCSDASSFVTGQNLCIDGGWTTW